MEFRAYFAMKTFFYGLHSRIRGKKDFLPPPKIVLKALFFIKIALKLSYFSKKMQNFRTLGLPPHTSMSPAAVGFAPRPPASGDWGLRSWTSNGFRRLRSQTPKTAPLHCEFLAKNV